MWGLYNLSSHRPNTPPPQQNQLQLFYPEAEFLLSKSNQVIPAPPPLFQHKRVITLTQHYPTFSLIPPFKGQTEGDIGEMGTRLAKEVG